ncbi:hypothetical protein LI951_12165 [Enterococcus sp. BWT-B8]|uniref:hypothetical protein n=1 Tax=unclassified Enterococcus TaxID=2608891 RepID=UPI001E29AC0C|nr:MULTISPECIES: hypothetical protein [unclassified Enterococcus]MCB5952824.1 hypothetical protein [Enterococcus sp. BWT-B8]MCB5953829.1 hypothetical protein [Enterococcus sp. CWB-B31]
MTINEKILGAHLKEQPEDDDDSDSNSRTLILDTAHAPHQIKYPTDTKLLNDARTLEETIIDTLYEEKQLNKPRTYRRKAREVYLPIVHVKIKAATEFGTKLDISLANEVARLGKIDRNRNNLNYCKQREIRLSGPALGYP